MKIECPHCNQTLESEDDLSGQSVECPGCSHSFSVPQPRTTPARINQPKSRIDRSVLRDPKEGKAFGWLIFFSLIAWLLLAVWIISSLGVVLIIIGLIAFVRWIVGLFVLAHIKTNTVQVSEKQFPEIHAIARDFAGRLGQSLPAIYVMQEGTWNAFAARFAWQREVILLSGAIDSLLLKGNMNQLAWVVGHELGHHYAGHLNFWRHATAQMGSWFVWVGLWHRRRCELTCDRYGLACANSLPESLLALCNMTVGAQLASQVNIDEAIAQWQRHRSEFIVKYRTLYSMYPHLLSRMEELTKSAQTLRIEQ